MVPLVDLLVALTIGRGIMYRLALMFWVLVTSFVLELLVAVAVVPVEAVGGAAFSSFCGGGFRVVVAHFFEDASSLDPFR